jgi:hypothetical protein
VKSVRSDFSGLRENRMVFQSMVSGGGGEKRRGDGAHGRRIGSQAWAVDRARA